MDLDDSDDEREADARYRARRALIRTKMLESQNLTVLAENPKAKAFIDSIGDHMESEAFIQIEGEEFPVTDVPQKVANEQDETDTLATSLIESQESQESSVAELRSQKRMPKKRTLDELRTSLSFLLDDEDEQASHSVEDVDLDTFSMAGRRASLANTTFVDRSLIHREPSDCNSIRTKLASFHSSTMYATLSRESTIVDSGTNSSSSVSTGGHIASRMATKAVNYRARIKAIDAKSQEGINSKGKKIRKQHSLMYSEEDERARKRVMQLFA